MNEPQTWRELLATLIADPQERQSIAEVARISPITLLRWSTNKSNPRMDNLRPLLEAMPGHKQRFTELIAREFPNFLREFPVAETPMEIPAAFYARVLDAYVSIPPILRASTIRALILQQIVTHFDPYREGSVAIVAQCMPPAQGYKVRSLRRIQGRGTPPWMSQEEERTQFFGTESQIGMALQSGRPVVVQSQEVKARLFPAHSTNVEKSTAVFPNIQNDRVAGCLYLASILPNFFSQARLDLAKRYADLLVLTFEGNEFFDLQNVELGIMPSVRLQQELIATFPQRVTQQMIRGVQNGQPLTMPEAELRVWQQIEAELLHDEPQWSSLYARLLPSVEKWARNSIIPAWRRQYKEVAEDITQEAIMRTLDYDQRANPPIDALEAFRRKIAHNLFLDLCKKEWRIVHPTQDQSLYHGATSLYVDMDWSIRGKEVAEKHLALYAIARAELEDENKAFVEKKYLVKAGITQTVPDSFNKEQFKLSMRQTDERILFDISIHASENIRFIGEWHQDLHYDPSNLDHQVVEFEFEIMGTGPSFLSIDFYHERHWLRTLRLVFDALRNPHLSQSLLSEK